MDNKKENGKWIIKRRMDNVLHAMFHILFPDLQIQFQIFNFKFSNFQFSNFQISIFD